MSSSTSCGRSGGFRQVTQISEVLTLGKDGHYALRDIFNLQPGNEGEGHQAMQLLPTGERSSMAGHLKAGMEHMVTERTADIFEIDKKSKN